MRRTKDVVDDALIPRIEMIPFCSTFRCRVKEGIKIVA